MKTVVVTGSAGFIGTNLVRKLLSLGHRVIGVDYLYSSNPGNEKIFNSHPNYTFIKHDIRKPLSLKTKVDAIYNFASPASMPFITKDPIFTLETSVLGVKNMLELAQKHQAKFLQASTSEVYGEPLEHPQKESYRGNVNTIGPRSCYDEGKRAAETVCFEYFQKGVDVKIIRIFNTYGPHINSKDGRVVVNLIVQALNNQNLTVYGNGQQTRSFCYIDDLVAGIIKYMNLKKKYLGPINLGNPNEKTILELTQTVLKLIPQSKSKIVYRPLPKDDPSKRKPDISGAKKVLNWQPKVSLKEGLKKTIEYFRKSH
ncbi:MAG: UDP-glucuronic acid decarboxylase family protein [Patescibacteria group bacterium]